MLRKVLLELLYITLTTRGTLDPVSSDQFEDITSICRENLVKGDSRDPQQWDPLMGSFPNPTPIRIPKDMGGWYGKLTIKGVPLLGVPEKFPYLVQNPFTESGLCDCSLLRGGTDTYPDTWIGSPGFFHPYKWVICPQILGL